MGQSQSHSSSSLASSSRGGERRQRRSRSFNDADERLSREMHQEDAEQQQQPRQRQPTPRRGLRPFLSSRDIFQRQNSGGRAENARITSEEEEEEEPAASTPTRNNASLLAVDHDVPNNNTVTPTLTSATQEGSNEITMARSNNRIQNNVAENPEQQQQHPSTPSPPPPITGSPPRNAISPPQLSSGSSFFTPDSHVSSSSTPTEHVIFDHQNNANNSEQQHQQQQHDDDEVYMFRRRSSYCSSSETGSTISDLEETDDDDANTIMDAFYPQPSRNFEWMGRSVESLIWGHVSRAPLLHLPQDGEEEENNNNWNASLESSAAARRRSTASTYGGGGGPSSSRRRYSQGSLFPRGSLSLSGNNNLHGGTLANYHVARRRQVPTDVDRSYSSSERHGQRRRGSTTSHSPMYRRRSSVATSDSTNNQDSAARAGAGSSAGPKGGPNVLFSIMAQENTGKPCFPRGIPATQCLRAMGGNTLYSKLDKPAAGIATEVAFLAAAIDTGDWAETQTIISRIAPRIIGEPAGDQSSVIEDPNLPPTAPRFYAGGGRTGLERDAFVQAGGTEVLIRIFREKSFVGEEMACSYDARDLSPEIVVSRLAPCWNEALMTLRELVYSMPSLVEDRRVSDDGDFLPFLFTLLSHDSCFDGAASLIEEILALLSQSPQQIAAETEGVGDVPTFQPVGRVSPPTTFFLGNVPDLYKLWAGFNCRQLAHFCRILALLVFEPEDRQLLETSAVLKSLELLQLRRNRAVRAGRDSTVDMNQAILLGDEELIKRLLKLLRVMNFAPSLRKITPYHVMAQYPFIPDTLIMLGLNELDSWDEIDRQEGLARKFLDSSEGSSEEQPLLSELGDVAAMLESLSEPLGESSNQIGHIIQVISAAQQHGVIVGGGSRRRGTQGDGQSESRASYLEDEDAAAALRLGGMPVDSAAIQGLASVANILTDQVLVRRLYQSTSDELGEEDASSGDSGRAAEAEVRIGSTRHLINTPEDSANSLQFNAMLLSPYQVEILFVLCTLMGGRRKFDAQDKLNRLGMIPVLNDMFQRLPWYKRESQPNEEAGSSNHGPESQPNGIHGPGCECTPESALCVQYLRLLHNFCDRDCDNYTGRRLLLSESERRYIFTGWDGPEEEIRTGLLTKIIGSFVRESDESPYRFWLASCIESYLRGSSPGEQMFAAQSGLLTHLIEVVSSDRLHCAGSLQTSFDLLGELCKGNVDVVRMLVNDLDEKSFRKLMSVAAANLVDSNVFIRSLLLSMERLSAVGRLIPLYMDAGVAALRQMAWVSRTGESARYLTHTWWDTQPLALVAPGGKESVAEETVDEDRQSDWFPTQTLSEINAARAPAVAMLPPGLEESVGHFGWVFTPGGETLSANTYLPNTVERLSWFLAANQARLLRDLLGVVDLRNINHENICCLNTAVVVAIFAHRRRQLSTLLHELRQMNDEEKESKRRAFDEAEHDDDVVGRAFVQAMRYLDLENQREVPPYARIASVTHSDSQQIGDRADVIRNFREVLWFWTEYYTHRGRDRLSLEFSSHVRFQEWHHVVSLLTADDGSPNALVRGPVRLPRSPYQRAARISENPFRAAT